MTRPLVLRSVVWYGDGPGSWEFEAVPPVKYQRTIGEDGQLRGYRVTGTLRHDPDSPPDLELVNVTDLRTGAVVEVRGDSTTLQAPTAVPLEYVRGLWRDGRYLAGLARAIGRSSHAEQRLADYRRAVLALRPEYPYPTIAQVLEYLGMHDTDTKQVRRDIGFRWRDWLATID